MAYKKAFTSAGIALFTIMVVVWQSSASVPAQTVSYLNSQAQSNPWIVMALNAAGEAVSADQVSSDGLSSATDIERTILAVTSAGQNPRSFNSHDLVAELDSKRSDSQIGETNLINDDIWGILAYYSAGIASSDARIQESKDFILNNIAAEGGWGYAVNTESDTNDTAMVVIALTRAGLGYSDNVIQNALAYLQSAQNDDGGFGIAPGSDSDSASTSWIISALQAVGIDPASWGVGSNNPFTYLDEVSTADGSYKWKLSDESGNTVMTTYAAIALSGKSYPVRVVEEEPVYVPPKNGNANEDTDDEEEEIDKGQRVTVRFRIEGSQEQLCAGEVEAQNPLEVVEKASVLCDLSYVIEETSFGSYLSQIGDDEALGTVGWLYLVNWEQAQVGAIDYQLKSNDYVTWYYGEYTWVPLKLSIVEQLKKDDDRTEVFVQVDGYQDEAWTPKAGIDVSFGSDTVGETGISGRVSATLEKGVYVLVADQTGYVRSNPGSVTVGDLISKSIPIKANIELNNGGGGGTNYAPVGPSTPEVSFNIDVRTSASNVLEFGSIQPGQDKDHTIELSNDGLVKLTFTSSVTGDELFVDYLMLNSDHWKNFSEDLQPRNEIDVEVSLEVPSEYSKQGAKEGELIFWATP